MASSGGELGDEGGEEVRSGGAGGRPICCEIWPGNTADAKSLVPVVERMRAKFRVREICVVADRGFVSEATLEALSKMDPPVHYVIRGAGAGLPPTIREAASP